MNKIQRRRLLNVARALRESPAPREFSMNWFGKPNFGKECGTPCCAFGHYAARRDLQRTYRLTSGGSLRLSADGDVIPHFDDFDAQEHFGLTEEELDSIFDYDGCADAKTPKQAALFIERFVARKEKEGR